MDSLAYAQTKNIQTLPFPLGIQKSVNEQPNTKKKITYKILTLLQLGTRFPRAASPSKNRREVSTVSLRTELSKKKPPPKKHLRQHRLTFLEIHQDQVWAMVLVRKS